MCVWLRVISEDNAFLPKASSKPPVVREVGCSEKRERKAEEGKEKYPGGRVHGTSLLLVEGGVGGEGSRRVDFWCCL